MNPNKPNDFDVYFNSLGDPNIDELSGFFSKIKKGVKKLGKGVEKGAKKVHEVVKKQVKRVAPEVATLVAGVYGGPAGAQLVGNLTGSKSGQLFSAVSGGGAGGAGGLLSLVSGGSGGKVTIKGSPPAIPNNYLFTPPAAATIPNIGAQLAPDLKSLGLGAVASTAVNLLKDSPVGANVLKTIGDLVGPEAIAAANANKSPIGTVLKHIVSPEVQTQVLAATTKLKMEGKEDKSIVGEFLNSNLFKSIAAGVTQAVVGNSVGEQLQNSGLPPETIQAEINRKGPVIAVAAVEEVARKAPASFDVQKLWPLLPFALLLLRK